MQLKSEPDSELESESGTRAFHSRASLSTSARGFLFLLPAALLSLSCGGDGGTPSAPEQPAAPEPTTISVQPTDARLLVGNERNLSATVIDQFGDTMPGHSVTWSSGDHAVVKVTRGGTAEAVGGGSTSVAATAGSTSGQATITVPEPLGTVGRDGGEVVAEGGRIILEFPSETVFSRTTITVAEAVEDSLPDSDGEDSFVDGSAFEFAPSGVEFHQEASLSLEYDPSSLEEGVPEELLRIHRLENGAWSKISSSRVDPEANRVSAPISGFSIYGILAIENDPPAVSITAPEDGATFDEGAPITFEGSSEDSDDGALEGDRLMWESDVDGTLGTGGSVSVDNLSLGAHVITLTGTDSDGLAASDSIEVTVEHIPPEVTITAPEDGTKVQKGEAVILEGSAEDAADGALEGESLVWESDLDGTLGTGTSLVSDDLSRGDHLITLTATDSDGMTASDQVTVTVEIPLLEDEVPVENLSGDADSKRYFRFEVGGGSMVALREVAPDEAPFNEVTTGGSGSVKDSSLDGDADISSISEDDVGTVDGESATLLDATLRFVMGGGTGDADLYVRHEAVPTLSTFTCRPYRVGNDEVCEFRDPADGTWYVMVHGYDAYSGVDIQTDLRLDSEPVATIVQPADGSAFEEGTAITFEGTGEDLEDGSLSGSALVWTSDLDGELGTGQSLTVASLSDGTHQITLTVTDSDGTTDEASIGIWIDGSPTVTLSEPGHQAIFQEGDLVTLSGSGDDFADGPLSGAALTWTSSADGSLGTGETVSTSALSAGPHRITLTGTDSDGHTASASVDILVESPGFDIRSRLLASFSDSELATIESALAPWESAIVGDLSPRFPSSSLANDCLTGTDGIDDLLVVVLVQSIDGTGGVLAQAGPCIARVNELGRFTTPVSGFVIIDQADRDNPQLEQIMAHEVGHVLGIGIGALHGWGSNLADLGSQDPGFHGTHAVTAFTEDLDGEAYLDEGIPLANTGGSGTSGAHWREHNFDHELMTGYINSGVFMPLSRVSVAALADIGYEVDLDAADDYALPMPQRALWLAEADATLSSPTSAGDNFGLPDGSTLSTSLVAGTNYNQEWSTDPESESYSALLRFGVPSGLAAGVTVDGTTLQLNTRARSFETSDHLIEVVPVTSGWSEGSVTWNSRPSSSSTPVVSYDFRSCSSCQLGSTGLADLAVQWLNGTTTNNGLLLRSPDAASDSTYSVGYWSRHTSTSGLRPVIRVDARTGAAVAAVPARAAERIPLGDDVLDGLMYGVGPTGRVERTEVIRGR